MSKLGSKIRRWTKNELRQLKMLARQKTHVREIARSLKRTVSATQGEAFKLGVSLLRVEFGRTRRQRQERDVSRNLEGFRAMPAGLIEDENC